MMQHRGLRILIAFAVGAWVIGVILEALGS